MTNLKEVRQKGSLEEFIAEHENDPPGDMKKFHAILRRVVGSSKEARSSSGESASGDCSDTRIPPRTSEGASGKRGRGSRGSSS
jgi:hypothetical protein